MSRAERVSGVSVSRPAGHAGQRVGKNAGGQSGISVTLHQPLPETVEIGDGQFVVISGGCRCDGADPVVGLELTLEDRAAAAELSPGEAGPVFWQALYLAPSLEGRVVAIGVRAHTTSGRRVEWELGSIRCTGVSWRPEPPPEGPEDTALVAICMATYSPDPDAFRRQVDSIRAQDFGNWLCIVQDDGSPEPVWMEMRRHLEDDSRFRLFRNSENMGFYRNFERVLTRVPEEAGYVAFCDQDDYWYPDKLSRLLNAMTGTDSTLAYSDMRIVDGEGTVIADTYWTNRRNEYRDPAVVLVANTVTGAASLFRRELLRPLVPFPPRVGDAFHDHWLACLALGTGRIVYIDEPLYDYYQYGSSVIGHCDFTRFSLMQRAASLVRFVLRLCRPTVAGPLLRGKYASSLAIYRGECRRLRLVGRTIRQRCHVTGSRERVLSLFEGGLRSVVGLLWLHCKVLARGQTTDDAELRLAMGEIARMIERRRAGWRH